MLYCILTMLLYVAGACVQYMGYLIIQMKMGFHFSKNKSTPLDFDSKAKTAFWRLKSIKDSSKQGKLERKRKKKTQETRISIKTALNQSSLFDSKTKKCMLWDQFC